MPRPSRDQLGGEGKETLENARIRIGQFLGEF